MTQPINPITVRGHRPGGHGLRNLTIGRLWLGENPDFVRDGQNALREWDKTMQFVIWDDPEAPLAHAVVQEAAVVDLLRKIRNKTAVEGVVYGTATRKSGDKVDVRIVVQGGVVTVTLVGVDRTAVEANYATFDRGLDHLFPRKELL